MNNNKKITSVALTILSGLFFSPLTMHATESVNKNSKVNAELIGGTLSLGDLSTGVADMSFSGTIDGANKTLTDANKDTTKVTVNDFRGLNDGSWELSVQEEIPTDKQGISYGLDKNYMKLAVNLQGENTTSTGQKNITSSAIKVASSENDAARGTHSLLLNGELGINEKTKALKGELTTLKWTLIGEQP
ncbi:hypothetical protein [Enterococcus ureasiticus]|uniref:WxL domain-containing protein n=1 Tax=Enterococcus ureasiticus TaxID=903984 RepID=A0A1E5GA29_9ENTE|nr:hypothetical protein [Enterococcus ureasiticus]OEG09517.1 hypothetical protein BCR21_14290 [Enterococcus ureasiticus]